MNKPKVLVIFPKHSDSDASHYGYWYPVFSQAGKKLDICILFETPTHSASIKNTKVLNTPNLPKPFNLIYRFYAIAKQIYNGYHQIYIHYSYSTFFITKLLTLFTPAKIYYWNCEYYQSRSDSDRILPIVLKLTNYLITGSDMVGERYQKIFSLRQPIKITSNYVSKLKSKPITLTNKKIHILFVHSLTPRKGAKELPQIIRQTLKLIPNAHFHIIGSGSGGLGLKSRLTEHQLLARVSLYGNLSRKQTAAFYKTCDIFIMPSRSEGFPRVILEAMLYQIAIVATNVGNVIELVGEQQKQFLVKPNNPKKFVQTIHKLHQLKSKKTLLNQNFQKAQEYNMNRAVKEFVDCFSDSHSKK